jgi:chaperonin GroEL
LRQIVENSGGPPDVVLNKVLRMKNTHGYNASLDEYGDMFEMGIIDPLKVVRSALENAASAASMMLTVGCAMIDDTEDIE